MADIQYKYLGVGGTQVLANKIKENIQAIAEEVSRAKDVEKSLTDSIAILNGDSSTEGSVKRAISEVIGTAPEALDTLGEIAAALNNDADFSATLINQITAETTRAQAAEKANADAIELLKNAEQDGSLANLLKQLDTQVKANETKISSNTSAIDILNGDATTEGSVAKAVADEKARAQAAETANTTEINSIKTILDSLSGLSTEGLIEALKSKVDVDSMVEYTADEVEALFTNN